MTNSKKHIYVAHHKGTHRLIEAEHKAGVRSHIAGAWDVYLPSQHQFLELLQRGLKVEAVGVAQTQDQLSKDVPPSQYGPQFKLVIEDD